MHNAKGFYLLNSAVAALFATDRITGLVVSLGAEVSHVVPIVKGFRLSLFLCELLLLKNVFYVCVPVCLCMCRVTVCN